MCLLIAPRGETISNFKGCNLICPVLRGRDYISSFQGCSLYKHSEKIFWDKQHQCLSSQMCRNMTEHGELSPNKILYPINNGNIIKMLQLVIHLGVNLRFKLFLGFFSFCQSQQKIIVLLFVVFILECLHLFSPISMSPFLFFIFSTQREYHIHLSGDSGFGLWNKSPGVTDIFSGWERLLYFHYKLCDIL